MKKIFFSLFLLIVLFSLNDCKGEEKGSEKEFPLKQTFEESVFRTQAPEDKDTEINEEWVEKIKEEKEILISETAQEVRPIWCGPASSLVYSDLYKGMFLHAIETGRKTKVAEGWNTPLGCTSGGEWLIHLGKVRRDKETGKREVADIWRYEIRSGRREKLAVADLNDALNIRENILSPDGSKVFLGRDTGEAVEMPEPKWEIIRAQDKWSHSSSIWLNDSSAVVSSKWRFKDKRDLLEVNVLTSDRRTITLDPGLSDFLFKLVDGQNRVYMKVWDKESGEARRIARCALDLDKQKVSCRTMLERSSHIYDFDVFPDNETIVFAEAGGKCVMVMRPGEIKPDCITTSWHELGYEINISPDGKWLAYWVLRKRDDGLVSDELYVVNLIGIKEGNK